MARQINLINPSLRKTREWLSALPMAAFAAALLLIVVVLAVVVRVSAAGARAEAEQLVASQKQAQESLLATAQQISTRKPDPQLAADLGKTRALVQRQQEILDKLDSGAVGDTLGFSEFLRGFARQVPQGLWLTGFNIGAGGRDMEVRGRMVSPSLLTEYVRRLNAESAFRGRSFAGLQIQMPKTERPIAGAPEPTYTEFVLSAVAPGEQR
jgi:MSHA biogenesis protein MshI